MNEKTVNLKPFKLEKMTKDKKNKLEVCTVEMPLDSAPDLMWVYIFEQQYKASLYLLKRPVKVQEASLMMTRMPHDDFKANVEWLKNLVELTNYRWLQYQSQLGEQGKNEKPTEKFNVFDNIRKHSNLT